MNIGERSKVQAEHLARSAFVYVRQSSMEQVRHHLESQRRQYAFADEAVALGWSQERVVIVDEDQGKSGAVPHARAGFAKLVGAVARGEVGIVMSLELSRLSRNDADWSHLVYLCRWTGALIADEQGVYDPSLGADRLVLGLRGHVSEMERDSAVHRMVEARWSKARRGEAFTIPPAGYDLDELGRWVLSADEAVQLAVRRVFDKFDELGAVRQVFLWWRDEGLPFPVRRIRPRAHPIAWVAVSYPMLYTTLRHPIYAGTFVFGRSVTTRALDPETQRMVVRRNARRAMKDWPVLIHDHHPAYISWDQYLRNQERLRNNAVMTASTTDESHAGAAREGAGLLQGLARCGHCGRRMYINYGGARIQRTLQYRCARHAKEVAGAECQIVGGKRIEATVVEAFLAVTVHAGSEAAALAGAQLGEDLDAAQRSWQLQIEKAEYEAQRAERQYMAVEPENRTIARELERRWNARLEELEAVRAQARTARTRGRPLTEEEIARAQTLGQDLEVVWRAPTTTNRDRKRLLRALIEEVQFRTDEKHHRVRVVWKGGAVTDRELVRFRPSDQSWHKTAEEIVELVRTLAREFDDAQIARVLNRQGHRSGLKQPFTKTSVSSLRHKHGIPVCPKQKPRDAREGPFTADEAALELGVTASTVHHWLRQGLLAGEQLTSRAPWRIVLTDAVRRRVAHGDAPAGWIGLTEAARRLGVGKPLVAYWVKQGKLPAVRTTVGRRRCWRIDVSSATCARQRDLFDQKINAERKEP
jgi:excisionase family DNA binding protein